MGLLSAILSPFRQLHVNEPILKFFAIFVISKVLVALDTFLDFAFHWTLKKGSRLERERALEQGRRAQLHRHLATSNTFGSREFTRYQLHHLLLVHDRYVDPEWILRHDNVFVWDVDKDEIFFAVTEQGVDLFDVSEHPWAWMHISHLAKFVLVMSLRDFHRVAEKLGNPSARLTAMHTTPRGGSTLITHMMHKLPKTRAVAEVWILFYLQRDAKAMKRSTEEVLRMMHNILRFIARDPVEKGGKLEHVFLKLTSSESNYFFALPKMFPGITMIFNSRMPKASIQSFGRLTRRITTKSISLLLIQRLVGRKLVKWFVIPMPLKNEKMIQVASEILENDMEMYDIINNNVEEFISLRYMASVQNFLEYKHLYKMVLLYEDLMLDPPGVVAKLLQIVAEPSEHLPRALEAMNVDSQKGYGGGVGAKDDYVVPERIWKKIDSFANRLGFPITTESSEKEFRDVLKLN